MTSQQLRQKFLEFYKKNDHVIIPSAPLMPSEEEQLTGKEKVLFTSAGMQQLIPSLMGKPHPKGNKLANVQKCLRTDDIEEVGDGIHHTFFEMLGNWSLGDYWKDEAIRLSFKFLTEELKIPKELLAVSVFAGDEDAPRDEESAKAWESLGVPKDRIFYFGKEYNWWPTGEKSGPCGPDTEMFYWAGAGKGEGKPNENLLWVEIWNDVFMEFNRKDDGTLEELPQKNVDTGMGLERILAVLNGKDNDYETDLFKPIFIRIKEQLVISYGKDAKIDKSLRIIADHLKAAVFLIKDKVIPSNKLQGYILRRLLRRAAVKINSLKYNSMEVLPKLIDPVFDIYQGTEYFKLGDWDYIRKVVEDEINKFHKTLLKGLREIENLEKIDGKIAFDLYQSYGFPKELTEELLRERGLEFDQEQYEEEFRKHQEISRSGVGIFKGGLADHSEIVTKYHTATHLLHQALKDVLGLQVFQRGSNITAERLRFDFSFNRKMTDKEIQQVEEIVNNKIKEDLKVDYMIKSLDEARAMGAIGLFDEKYTDKISIYGIGAEDNGEYYSLEFCGGPHVEHTGVIGKIKIIKEEAKSFGVRRIRMRIVLR